MLVRENQVTNFHFHCNKREDIINRCSGYFVIDWLKTALDKKVLGGGVFDIPVNGMR